VEVGYSPRSLRAEEAVSIFQAPGVPKVALLLEPSEEDFSRIVGLLRPQAVQLVGEETPALVKELAQGGEAVIWKSVHLPPAGTESRIHLEHILHRIYAYQEAGAELVVLDTVEKRGEKVKYGGTGLRSDWEMAQEVVKGSPLPILLAGGLGPENVVDALREVKPFGVDMASGVESSVGVKDPGKVKAVVRAVREFSGMK
jgi:phosphoribosylanthranilate isomerase